MNVPWDAVRMPQRHPDTNPLRAVVRRIGIAFSLVIISWVLVMVEHEEYTDDVDGEVSPIDALYYTTVTLTTTGYGDITPVTESARLLNALVVTPLRLGFVFVLVGTTVVALTERSRSYYRVSRWRQQVKDHVIVCGFGTTGRSAYRELTARDAKCQVVVVDPDAGAVADAAARGLVAVQGDATSSDILRQARISLASAVIVAANRDDTSVLITLTTRRLNQGVPIIASARAHENVPLLRQSGATSVITSSESVGRLLGLATNAPSAVRVIDDLLDFGHGLDIVERLVSPAEVGGDLGSVAQPVVAVLRDGAVLSYDHPQATPLQAGDLLVLVSGVGHPHVPIAEQPSS